MSSEANDEPRATYTCGRCGLRWHGERTTAPVGCPKCRNYSKVGFVRAPPDRPPRSRP
ncbi:MAG TPA: hypothetical protein PLG75_07820 [Methanoculleus sp.]|nr:hypothetical protein [Methanoculleus sp.]